MSDAPDFTGWDRARLVDYVEHLDRILLASVADPGDPMRPQLKAERKAARAALDASEQETEVTG